jgi:FMN phosphatase YigB (HAD superfamily)
MPYHAVSLDLWYTTVYHLPGEEARWTESRIRFLHQVLRRPDGRSLPPPEIRAATESVHLDLEAAGRNTGKVDPGEVLRAYASRLKAVCTLSDPAAGERFSSIGLDEHPPILNPEVVGVVRAFRERGVPIIMITNTARRASTWRGFLTEQQGVPFEQIIASCEVGSAKPDGAIFEIAARRLGMPADEILHVGDRWELDVVGAQRAGFGAALYRGLWPRYPDRMYPETDSQTIAESGVLCIDRLEELLVEGLVTAPPAGRPSTRT